jgi:acyl-CoA hydrolase
MVEGVKLTKIITRRDVVEIAFAATNTRDTSIQVAIRVEVYRPLSHRDTGGRRDFLG